MPGAGGDDRPATSPHRRSAHGHTSTNSSYPDSAHCGLYRRATAFSDQHSDLNAAVAHVGHSRPQPDAAHRNAAAADIYATTATPGSRRRTPGVSTSCSAFGSNLD